MEKSTFRIPLTGRYEIWLMQNTKVIGIEADKNGEMILNVEYDTGRQLMEKYIFYFDNMPADLEMVSGGPDTVLLGQFKSHELLFWAYYKIESIV